MSESSISNSFHRFPQLPTEIRTYIWEICATDYPARIVDLREYKEPSSSNPTGEIVGFKSRAPAPTLLYACQDSRNIAKSSYVKAFGSADMPAETWMNFDKDVLYISHEFFRIALDGYDPPSCRYNFLNTEKKGPKGYFLKDGELHDDMRRVKDFAISGIWEEGFNEFSLYENACLTETQAILKLLTNLERFTLVDAQHAPNTTSNLVFTAVSRCPLTPLEDEDDNAEIMDYRQYIFEKLYAWTCGRVWSGLQSYPWFKFGTLMERSLCGGGGGIPVDSRPRSKESRLATDEIRRQAVPDPARRRILDTPNRI